MAGEFFRATGYWEEAAASLCALHRKDVRSRLCHCLSSHDPQGSKKKNLNKQEMSKYLRFIVQRMKERVRRTVLSFPVSLMSSACGAALTLLAEPGRTSVVDFEGTETNRFLQRTRPARSG